MSKTNSWHFHRANGNSGGSSQILNNRFPTQNSQSRHIFRNAEGHLQDTPENRNLMTATANNSNNFVGNDKYGNQWYPKIQFDGSQIWIIVRNGTIQNAGKKSAAYLGRRNSLFTQSKSASVRRRIT